MKIDRHSRSIRSGRVKLAPDRWRVGIAMIPAVMLTLWFLVPPPNNLIADDPPNLGPPDSSARSVSRSDDLSPTRSNSGSHIQAVDLLRAVIDRIVHGPAFDAKVRETVWTTGRSVVGVGTYEQAGGGSGRYNLQVTMHDGDGKHRLQQISDGRLAWTRREIAGKVSLRRVDVGLLDQWVSARNRSKTTSPRLKVGAWPEMLSAIERDYVLEVVGARLKDEPVWVVKGKLREQRRKELMERYHRNKWAEMHPTQVRVAIRSKPDPETRFGALLPIRIEFLSDPPAATQEPQAAERSAGRLISLIEIYSIRRIEPPPEQRFRFDNRDAEVNFVNETDRYIQMYGVELTERQRRQLNR